MTAEELRAHIVERIEFNKYICGITGREPKDSDMVMTLVGTSMRGIGVRPNRLGSQYDADGNPINIYGFSLKQCRKLLRTLDEAEA